MSSLNVAPALSSERSLSAFRADDSDKRQASIARMLARILGGCAIAHWYMIPGRDVWREYLRVFLRASLKSSWRRGAESCPEFAFQPLGARDFLACDFAWRDLGKRFSACSYLDVGSPWVLPLMIVRRVSVDHATLLFRREIAIDHLRNLIKTETKTQVFTAKFNELRWVGRERGPFDVVSSINWLAAVAEDAEALRLLWSAVKPGGNLLLSLPCVRSPIEECETPMRSKRKSGEGGYPAFAGRVYDQGLLARRIFEVVGQPKQQHIYGERTAGHYRSKCSNGVEASPANNCRESLAIGRDWSRFPRVDDLPGEGLVAMKFVKVI